MIPDPEPQEPIVNLNGQGSIMQSDACGPIPSHFLQLERRVPGIGCQQGKLLISQVLNRFWKRAIGRPERWAGKVIHNFFVRPAW